MICALAAIVTAGVLAGCGNNFYFDGRVLPPSGIANRVLIAIQNPSAASKGLLQFVDAFYDIRQSFNDKVPSFSISGYSGALPSTIQNMPEEQIGAVYGSGDGSFTLINYAKESVIGSAATLAGLSSSVFVSRNQLWVIAASQSANVLTVVDKAGGNTYALSLPGVNHVSMNPGGTIMLAFVQNSNYAYYPRKLTSADSAALAAFYLTNQTWPAPYVDCEPKNKPGMCLAQMQSPDNMNTQFNVAYGAPLSFDRPVKGVFSEDGSSIYILNCGPECGGNASSVSILPTGPFNVTDGQQEGSLPTTSALTKSTIAVPGGASNALEATGGPDNVDTLYVLGEGSPTGTLAAGQLFSGYLTPINLTNSTAGSPISVSDSSPGQRTRMVLADNNTLWLGGIRCTEGERYATGQPYGCLTMFNTSTNTVSLIEPYQGDLTGIAAVTSLNKVYIAEGGQVYIYSTTDGSAINNFYVTVTGTAYDVAYMDAITDGDNTVY
ncbi:hypothetical protein [Acidicapsa acidisoli]|uniref:hypothetical protein n=1 Tax=Acidicapsa acidisoli TaxID=1615681 RepID=UPI0021E0E534|nr:hypothetical protein [Acidicapsa acidisoli]